LPLGLQFKKLFFPGCADVDELRGTAGATFLGALQVQHPCRQGSTLSWTPLAVVQLPGNEPAIILKKGAEPMLESSIYPMTYAF
jgi:hypothetical protein